MAVIQVVHAAAALAWLLGGLGLVAMGLRARRSRSRDAVTAFARLLSHPAVRVSTPALMALILVSGVWLVEADSEWSLTQPWILLGLGLLAAALLRLSKAYTYVADIVPEGHPKFKFVNDMEAKYIDVHDKTPEQIVDFCCTPSGVLNIIFEASGAAATALELIPFMSRSSIYVMTGIPRDDIKIKIDAARLMRQIVRYNQVIVGSVNSNRSHFEMALADLEKINSSFGGMLDKMITRRVPLEDYQTAFNVSDPNQIKTIVEIEPW